MSLLTQLSPFASSRIRELEEINQRLQRQLSRAEQACVRAANRGIRSAGVDRTIMPPPPPDEVAALRAELTQTRLALRAAHNLLAKLEGRPQQGTP